MRSWRTLSRASLVAALSAAFLGAMAPAHANPVDGSFDSAIGAGSSSQHMRWTGTRMERVTTTQGCSETATRDTQSKPTLVGTAGGKSQTISMAPTSHRCSVWDPTCLKTGTLVTSSTAATCTGHVPLQPLPSSSYSQRIRTQYDNGTVFSDDHFPARCANDATWVPVIGACV